MTRQTAKEAPALRAVIYARYSTEIQREASIEDQVEVCRRYAAALGWTVVGRYEDAAISGANSLRPGFQRLLADAGERRFDVVVCEAVDRLGRKLSDVAAMFDRLTFLGIKLHASSIGPLTQMHIGIMGTMAQMTLTDLRDKTRRGQLGRARAGRIPGGLAYGYEVVPPPPGAKEAGERRIVPGEAAIVRQIFADYAAGRSPRHIARQLNAAQVPGPGGRPWGDTTIRGQVDRGTGLLNNTLYIGQLSWNRCSYVKDPSTGRRVARVNAPEQWEEVAVPALRIVSQEVWDAVRARQAQLQFEMIQPDGGQSGDGQAGGRQNLNAAHRRKFLLSGLLTCGACGGGFTIVAQDRYGCAAHRAKGTCNNNATIRRQRVEQRVLSGLRDRMLDPQIVAAFVKAFAAEAAEAHQQATASVDRLRAELKDVERRLEGVLQAVENGAWSSTLQMRSRDLEARQAALTAELAAAASPQPAVQLYPNAAALYQRKVADLVGALAQPDICTEAASILGGLIERVMPTPDADAPDGMTAALRGDQAAFMRLPDTDSANTKNPPGAGCGTGRVDIADSGEVIGTLVAGIGFEPMTFRL